MPQTVQPRDAHPRRVELRVTGAEQVVVPAGTFDCWRLTVEDAVPPPDRWVGSVVTGTTLWVRKADGLLVKSAIEWAEPALEEPGPGARKPTNRREVLLLSEAPMAAAP